jgi:hypothetical protein
MIRSLLARIRSLEKARPAISAPEIRIVFVDTNGYRSPAYTFDEGRLCLAKGETEPEDESVAPSESI